MAFLDIPNVSIRGIAACVPSTIDENSQYELLNNKEREKVILSVGVERKRIADSEICASDLCYKAAERLISDLQWDTSDIQCLIFVSQTPDYILPATSCVLQHRLNLSQECYTIDISLGCSGWIYGLSTISSILINGNIKKGLLLVGDITTQLGCREDTSYWPLFGDAGTATALEFNSGQPSLKFHLATDGEGYSTIMIPEGGYRNKISKASLDVIQDTDGLNRRKINTRLDGMDVFSFAMSKAPKSINALLSKFSIEQKLVDYYVFHQANMLLNEKIRKKMGIDIAQVPYSLKNYGNTSCATIPLTMVTELREKLESKNLKIIGCGFGVGLSWGSVYFETNKIVCPELIIY